MVGSEQRGRGTSWKRALCVTAVGLLSLTSGASGVAAQGSSPFGLNYFRGGNDESGAVAILTQHQSHANGRRLDTNATMNAAVDKANQVGASVRKAIKQLRGGTDKFYRDLITAVKITLCDNSVTTKSGTDNPKTRFVDANSDFAYKDDAGHCILLPVTAATDDVVKNEYAQGHCEVKPNCYWAEIETGDTERKPVWSITEAAQPADGAMTKVAAKDVLMKWAQGLMIFVVPGIILGVLSLLTMILFLICRCCCNKCGGRSPKEGGYTCMQKFWPLLFFLLFSIAVVVVAGVSLLYQKTVTGAISDTFDAGVETLDNAGKWIVDIRTPLEGIRDTVVTSADKIKVQLAGSDFIEEGLTGLTTRLEDFGAYSADRTLPEGCTMSAKEPFCLPCVVCTTISTEVGKATGQIKDNAGAGIDQLRSVRQNLNGMLVDIASSVKNTVNSLVDTLNNLIKTIDDAEGQVTDVQGQFEKQKAPQKAGVLVLFALALLVIVIGFVGILFGLTPLKFLANIIHIAYLIGFIALFLTFIISAVFLAISVVLGDVCEVTNILKDDWVVVMGDPAKGLNACFMNESLIDTFNLSSSLEFARGGIEFPENNLATMLDFSELDGFSKTILDTNASTFRLDETKITDFITLLNKYVTQSDPPCSLTDTYTAANILTPWTANGASRTGTETGAEFMKNRYKTEDVHCAGSGDGLDFECTQGQSPCTFSAFIGELYHNVSMLAMVKRDSGQFITDLHTNITKVTDYTGAFKTNTTNLDGRITTIRTDLEASLIKSVNDFEHAMYCTFIADGYFKIYQALCGDLMPAFTMISLMMFLAGVFLFPVNVCLIIACKRLKARGNGGHVMDNEMKFK